MWSVSGFALSGPQNRLQKEGALNSLAERIPNGQRCSQIPFGGRPFLHRALRSRNQQGLAMARRDPFLPLDILLTATKSGSLAGVDALRGPGWAMKERREAVRDQGSTLDRVPGPGTLLNRCFRKPQSTGKEPCLFGLHHGASWVITVLGGRPLRPAPASHRPFRQLALLYTPVHGNPTGLACLRAHLRWVRELRH